MKTLAMKQGSGEWLAARLGVVTASEADALLTPAFKLRDGAGVETYLYKKLAEKLLGYSPDSANTLAMENGSVVETIARPWFAFTYDVDVATPGFCVSDDGRIGCSPDGMLPDGSGLEIKSPMGANHLRYLVKNEVPADYRVQVAFSLYVTNAPHWNFVSFHRSLPALVVKVERDPKADAAIKMALEIFFEKFDPIYLQFKRDEDAENARRTAEYYKSEGITP